MLVREALRVVQRIPGIRTEIVRRRSRIAKGAAVRKIIFLTFRGLTQFATWRSAACAA
jgi:transposase